MSMLGLSEQIVSLLRSKTSPRGILWHMVPLQRMPRVLLDRSIYAAEQLQKVASPLLPRNRNAEIDRDWGVSNHVHLYLHEKQGKGMLESKISKGYPHCLLGFPTSIVCEVDVERLGFLAGNPLASSRGQVRGIEHRVYWGQECLTLLKMNKAFRSASILVPESLSLRHCVAIECFSEAEQALVRYLAGQLQYVALPPVRVLFYNCLDRYAPTTLDVIRSYFDDCVQGKRCWRNPPCESEIPFD